jgi:hypothetical protein
LKVKPAVGFILVDGALANYLSARSGSTRPAKLGQSDNTLLETIIPILERDSFSTALSFELHYIRACNGPTCMRLYESFNDDGGSNHMKCARITVFENVEGSPDEFERLTRGQAPFSETQTVPAMKAANGYQNNNPHSLTPKLVYDLWRNLDSVGQRNMIAAVVDHGGRLSLDDLCKELDVKPGSLRGYSAGATRQYQKATGHDDARLIEYARMPGDKSGYKISEPALTLLADVVRPAVESTKFLFDWSRSNASAGGFAFVEQRPRPIWFEVWFVLKEWEAIGKLRNSGARDSADGRLLIFWFGNEYGEDFGIYLGIAPSADRATAERVFQALRASAFLSSTSNRDRLYEDPAFSPDDWTHLWSRRFASASELTNPDRQQITDHLDANLKTFIADDLPKIRAAVDGLKL